MKIYINNDKNNIALVQSVASASTMISSVAHEAKKYVLSKFPKGFFKHVYIDTAQTVSQQHRNDRYNSTANKIPYPSMGITPEISLDDPIGGMEKGLHLSSPNLYLRKDYKRNYRCLVEDPESKFSIYYTSDYVTTNFNFKLVTNSFVQNADLAFYLKSNFQKDFFQFLNGRYIQSEIPKTFIRTIADIKNWNMNNATEMDDLRLYLIGTSKQEQSIQKRTSLMTGKECFFLNEKQNFLVLFSDLDAPSSINRDSQVESEYIINFRLQVSCWIPNSYILSINKDVFKTLEKETQDSLNNGEESQEQGISAHVGSVYLLTSNNKTFEDDHGNQQIGQLLYKNIYTYSLNSPIPVINIIDKLPQQVLQVYMYAVNNINLDVSSLLNIYLYSTLTGPLDKNLYKFDINNISKGISVDSSVQEDIGLAIYINRVLYETIVKAMKTKKNYFGSNRLSTIQLNIGENYIDAVVKSFENISDKYSSDIEKSLRIQTAGGIGYISLKPERKNKHNAYKICIGYDGDNPIIREFEIE